MSRGTDDIRLWLVKETPQACQYSKVPNSRTPGKDDLIWTPKSIIEHVDTLPHDPLKEHPQHIVTLPLWFVEKHDL